MPDWTDLKFEMASCWKVSWKVEPLPLSVPLRAALLDEEDDALPLDELPAGGVEDVEVDEEHADRPSAVAMTATPTVVTCCLRRRCISGTPFTIHLLSAAMSSHGQPVSLQTVVCEYSLPALAVHAGKRKVDKGGPEG
jgi:hypothetical protein